MTSYELTSQMPDSSPMPPVDPMCFPPGILPELLTNLEDKRPYQPILFEHIQKEGLPIANEPDAYLQSRLYKFYAEVGSFCGELNTPIFTFCLVLQIGGYIGTKTRSQELLDRGKDPRGMLTSNRGDEHLQAAVKVMALDPVTGMRPDGSFVKTSGDKARGGLGSHRPESSESVDDVYNMYRRERSGLYHRGSLSVRAASGR